MNNAIQVLASILPTKSTPQSKTVTSQKHCNPFVPQLNIYPECLEKALGAKPQALLLHLPMIGVMVEIGRR